VNELEVLRMTREHLADERNWCPKGGRSGRRTCLMLTALDFSGGLIEVLPVYRLLGQAAHLRGQQPLHRDRGLALSGAFNDSHSHAEVLGLLDDVIAKLEEQEAGAPLPPLTTTAPVLA
jgi:hypothetical protein